jgi:hypothetical protein
VLIPIGFVGAVLLRTEISRMGAETGRVAAAVLNFLIITAFSSRLWVEALFRLPAFL